MHVECGPQTGCHGCSGSIPRGRRVWCSNECERRIVTNHVWGEARYAVLSRDQFKCVICGQDDKDDVARAYHKRHGKTILEVNHIQPVNGRRLTVSCANHQDNLETLCHDCHVAVTKQQREMGLLASTVRHWIQILRLPAGTTIFCVRCGVSVAPRDWAKKRREECPAGTKKSQRKSLRSRRKRRKM